MTRLAYHRENLRADLIAAGHAYVTGYGHEALSVRALSQRVGVSPGAPYHHFPDRRALLLALAMDGFKKLWEGAERVAAGGHAPAEQLGRLAAEFLAFQSAHPRLLELMYESELTRPTIDPCIVGEQLRGFELLRDTILAGVAGIDERQARARSVAFWSAIYGFASLTGKGLLRPIADAGDASLAGWQDVLIAHAVGGALAPRS